jgi:catechol 2,3-dioxygenase-like lactoylglutathione lyase family enzyme
MDSTELPFGELHHVGILVSRLAEAERAICALLGGSVVERGEDQPLGAAWLWIASPANPIIELLAPLDDDGQVAQDLRRRGQGLHHLSFQPADLSDAKTHAERCGLSVIGEDPDHSGYEELFIHPSMTGGALFHAFRTLPQSGAVDGEPSAASGGRP